MADKPVAKFRIGLVTATVWANSANGKTFHSVNLIRSYKDEHGDWQETASLQHADLLNAAKVLERAEEFIGFQGGQQPE